MSPKHRPYAPRNSEELSDYVTGVTTQISKGYVEQAARLLGYESFNDLTRRNPDGSFIPPCSNKIRKAERLEEARKKGEYKGPDYVAEISGLARKIYVAGKKIEFERGLLRKKMEEKFNRLDKLLSEEKYEAAINEIGLTREELWHYLSWGEIKDKKTAELLHHARIADLEPRFQSVAQRLANLHDYRFGLAERQRA